MVHRRLWVLGASAALVAWRDASLPTDFSDLTAFTTAGRRLLSADALHVFDDPLIQVGPLHLLVNGSLDLLAAALRVSDQALLSVVVDVGFTVALILVARHVAASMGRGLAPVAELALGGLALIWSIPSHALETAHLGEVAIPLLWLMGASYAVRDQQVRAGLLMAIATLVKPWGVLGFAFVLLGPRAQRWSRGWATGALVITAAYMPFMVWGHVRTLEYQWVNISSNRVLELFVDPGEAFGWPMRVVQASVAVVCGAAIALHARKRTSANGLWCAPLVVAGAYLLFDPVEFPYHLVPVQTIGLLGGVLVLVLESKPSSRALGALAYLLFVGLSVEVVATVAIVFGTVAAAAIPQSPTRSAGWIEAGNGGGVI